jgi:hypothetical protein
MPSFRGFSAAETAALEQRQAGARAQIARMYDAFLADFVVDDYGRADLAAGERRAAVRRQLHAAARRRGFALRFRPGPGTALIFRVEGAEASRPPVPAPSRPAPAPAPVPAQRAERVARRSEPRRPRGARRPETAAERYQSVLPRWMREGQPPARPGRGKRRG